MYLKTCILGPQAKVLNQDQAGERYTNDRGEKRQYEHVRWDALEQRMIGISSRDFCIHSTMLRLTIRRQTGAELDRVARERMNYTGGNSPFHTGFRAAAPAPPQSLSGQDAG
jgi:hypothetical protein